MAPSTLDHVRDRYGYACGYCGVSETSAGGVLTLDHYQPRTAGGTDELDNLVYACVKCNQYKHNFWPSAPAEMPQRKVLHPLLDDVASHLRLDEDTGQLVALSETGTFHIRLLRLNRTQLIKFRLSLQLQSILHEKLHLQAQQIDELQKTMAAQERYVSFLQSLLERLLEDN